MLKAYFIILHLRKHLTSLSSSNKKYCRSMVVMSQYYDKVLPFHLYRMMRIFIKCCVGYENSLL